MISRRQVLRGFSGVAASSVFTGCGASLYKAVLSPAAQPIANPQPVPLGAMTAASMTIASSGVGSVGKQFVGLSYEKASLYMPRFTGSNGDLIGLFDRLGKSVLRIGGNSVDENVWTPEGKGQTAGQIAPPDVDALAAFLKASGWSCIYGVNLGGSAMGTTTPELAAAEVAYVSEALGASLVGVEIGNECENYRDPGSFYQYDWTVEMFEALWRQYRDAIVSRTPGAPMVGPAAGSNVGGWTIPFGESVTAKQIGMVTQHYYRGPAGTATATVETLISPDTALVSELKWLREGAGSIGVPFRMAECNSFWGGGGQAGVSNAYASSLWAIDMIFECALGGAVGINFQGGDHGQYTVIEDNYGPVVGPRPVYYGLLMATLAGEGTLLANELNVGSLNVTGYVVKTADAMSVVVVNKDATQNLDMSIAVPESMHSATLQVMTQMSEGATMPSLTATSGVTIQGGSVARHGSFTPGAAYDARVSGRQLSCYVPALSAVVIRVV